MADHRQEQERARGATPRMDRLQALRSAEVHARFLLEHLSPGMSVLDCGCGRGAITLGIARFVSPASVEGLDIDAGRVRDAAELARSQEVENVRFQVGDIYELPFPDESFDAVYEHALFEHLDDPVQAAKEVLRVLKPGGVFGASDRIQTQGGIISPETPAYMEHARMRSVFHGEQGSDMNLGLYLHKVLQESGFIDVVPSASLECWSTPQEKRDIADWAINTIRSESFKETTSRLRLADQATLARHISEFEDFAANPDSWVAGPNGEALGWKPSS